MNNKEFIDSAIDTKFFHRQVKEKSLYFQKTLHNLTPVRKKIYNPIRKTGDVSSLTGAGKKAILFLFMLLCLGSCSLLSGFLGSVQEPKFSVKKVEITKITLQNVALKIFTGVKNPYPISLPKSNLEMDVVIEGTNDNLIE